MSFDEIDRNYVIDYKLIILLLWCDLLLLGFFFCLGLRLFLDIVVMYALQTEHHPRRHFRYCYHLLQNSEMEMLQQTGKEGSLSLMHSPSLIRMHFLVVVPEPEMLF